MLHPADRPVVSPEQITGLVIRASQGDRKAADALFVLVEDDLKAIARKRKRLAAACLDASTTIIVDEAFVRLLDQGVSWQPGDRRKFFGFIARQMQDWLAKAARAERAGKRGGGRRGVEADDRIGDPRTNAEDRDLLIDLEQALDRFERFAPDDALMFRVRYYLGCTFEEAANLLGVSTTEAKRSFERARARLENDLKVYHRERQHVDA